MDTMDWVAFILALVGALAWTPQIATWIYHLSTKPLLSIYPYRQLEIGHNFLGPIFNVRCALLSKNKDAILNKFSAKIKHESGALFTFDWEGVSEDLGEIQNPIGPPVSVKKTSLPLVIKVVHTGVSQVFVRFQHGQFKANTKEPLLTALDKFNLMKKSGKLKGEKEVQDLVAEKEFDDVLRLYEKEFIWREGEYTVTFEFESPNRFKYTKSAYNFRLTHDDVEILRKNVDSMKHDLIEMAKKDILPDYERKEATWQWRFPELQTGEVGSILQSQL